MHGDSRAGQEEGKPPAFLPLRFSGAGQERQGRGCGSFQTGDAAHGKAVFVCRPVSPQEGTHPGKGITGWGAGSTRNRAQGICDKQKEAFVLEWKGWRRSKAVQLAQTASGMTGDGCKRLVVGVGRGPSQRVGHNRGAKGRSAQQCRRARRRRMQQICHGTAGMKKALAVSCKG